MLDINADETVRQQVSDISVALENIEYDPKEKNIFYVLKSTDKGVFIILLRTIPSNLTDHLASWIFIPYTIEISDREIEDVLYSVRSIVSKSKIKSEEIAQLRQIFGKAYPELQQPGATVDNFGKQYAHRFYGGDTGYILSDYIGSKRYQTAYLQYAGVILADKNSVKAISGPNLTDEPLDQMVKILPPRPDDRPYRPLIFDRPFTQPFLVPLMGTVEIVWESSSAVDIRQSIMINKPNMRPDNISLASTRPTVNRNNYTGPLADDQKDTDDTQKDTKETQEKHDTKPTQTEAAPEKSALVTPKVQTQQQQQQPAEKDEAVRTINYDRVHLYKFEIPAKSAAISGMIRFEIKTHSDLTSSPIDGYELSESMQEGASRTNHLIYAPSESIQKKAIWGIAGFLVGILLTLLCTCGFSGGKSDTDTQAIDETNDSTVIYSTPQDVADAEKEQAAASSADKATTKTTANTPANVSLDEAIKYLDKNQKWDKNQLESYPDLRGLYDDMNNLRRERIVDYWGPKLKESRSFSKIVDHCQKSLKCKKKPRVKGNQTTYNPASDSTISVRNFLNTIDP